MSAIEIAKDWLRNEYTEIYGDRKTWTQETTDKFHAELGFLVNFLISNKNKIIGRL